MGRRKDAGKEEDGEEEENFSSYSGLTKVSKWLLRWTTSSPEIRQTTLQLPAGALIHWLTQSPFPNFFLYLLFSQAWSKRCFMGLLEKLLLLFSILFSVSLPLCAPCAAIL